MSVKIPSHFDFGLDLDISGIPTSYSFAITNIPKLNVGIDPLTLNVAPLQLEVKPLDMSFRIKEIPSVRMHFPADYRVGFTLLGVELACIRLCGQGQVITEPYVPNRCECGRPVRPQPVPEPRPTPPPIG